jgi:CelD/BcsL family acetyltransferase involved in cellulose biosynthesis
MEGSAASTDQLAAALRQTRASFETTVTTTAPYLKLPATWDDYLRSFNKKKRQSLTYALRDFHAWAGDDWRLEMARTPDELARGLRSLIDLHEQRWQAEAHGGAFASPRFQAFHGRFARLALHHQRLLLMTVVVRGQAVAALYAFHSDHKLYFYQCGRILSAPPKVRLGIVTVIFALQQTMKLGLREFDFLGGQAQYKHLFTVTERQIVQLRLARRGVRESLRRAARGTIQSMRAVTRFFSSLRFRGRAAAAPSPANADESGVNSG